MTDSASCQLLSSASWIASSEYKARGLTRSASATLYVRSMHARIHIELGAPCAAGPLHTTAAHDQRNCSGSSRVHEKAVVSLRLGYDTGSVERICSSGT